MVNAKRIGASGIRRRPEALQAQERVHYLVTGQTRRQAEQFIGGERLVFWRGALR